MTVVQRTFTVPLDHAGQLFVADPISPTSPAYTEYTAQPAMDTIRDELLMRMPNRNTQVVIEVILPGDQVRPGLSDELTEAVRRWVQVQNKLDVDATEAGGPVSRRLFLFGVLIFLALQMTSYLIKAQAVAIDEYLVNAIGEGLSVASWVMLWFPVQLMTMEVWRAGLRRRRMRVIERVQVVALPRT